MEKLRKPAEQKPSTMAALKSRHRKALRNDRYISLKDFVREFATEGQECKAMAASWYHNKRANFSKPPLGLGKTKRKKGKNGQK